jgi:hypothetical protein
MRCEVCGTQLTAIRTDLPFKVRETGMVILKGLPVLQWGTVPVPIEDAVLAQVDATPGARRTELSLRSSATQPEPIAAPSPNNSPAVRCLRCSHRPLSLPVTRQQQ